MDLKAIDCHIHCGVQNIYNPVKKAFPSLKEANIIGACVYPPVADIYDRYDKKFKDTRKWRKTRKNANNYLCDFAKDGFNGMKFFPYNFVWNDYDVTFNEKLTFGIKWHRHDNEPKYNYKSKKCEKFLQKIYKLKLPIVYEEEFKTTLEFIKRVNNRTIIIIPRLFNFYFSKNHQNLDLGMLNGTYKKLKSAKVFENKFVYTDTSLAEYWEIDDYISTYGCDRILFGSDWPMGNPKREKFKIAKMSHVSIENKKKIFYENILKLINVKKWWKDDKEKEITKKK